MIGEGWGGIRHLLVGGILLLLATACSVGGKNLTTAQTLFEMQSQYVNLGRIALRYLRLPICTPAHVERCADEQVVRAVKRADQEVYTVLRAAELARNTPDAEQYRTLATAALGRLRTVFVTHAIRGALQ